MLDQQVKFLCPVRPVGRHDDGDVGQCPKRPAVTRGEGQDPGALFPRRFSRPDDVRRIAARRMDDEEVVLPDQRLDLPGEHLVEPEVVPGRREERRIGGQGDRR
jgi:hypothetical protein